MWKKLVIRDHLTCMVNELEIIVKKFIYYCLILKPKSTPETCNI